MKKRNVERFLINNIVTERYKRSAVPAMKKMLNEEDLRLKRAMQNINIVPREHCFINSISKKIVKLYLSLLSFSFFISKRERELTL